MRLSELQEKDIVNIINGKNLGKIIDVTVENGKMYNLIIESKKNFFNFLNNREEITIRWENIEKIGEDVILVKNIN